MKTFNVLISTLVLIGISVLYLLGSCQWDLSIYIAGVVIVLMFMLFNMYQEKKYNKLINKKNTL